MASVVGEASSSSPASTSIPPRRSYTYHVFLSFRGADTRKGFTGHLHTALERKGIKTFLDDRYLEAGDVVSAELRKAIEESMFAVIVLSPDYASSGWCLDELQHIVECSESLGLSIEPVFYDVEPCHVRYQKGTFEAAFKKHEERFRQDSEKLKKVKGWRDALARVASLSGWVSKNQNEAAFVERIAQHIHRKMIPKLPPCTGNLVGIASRVDEVMTRHICIGLNDVRFIGILGVGGIGKTTITTAVYEAIQCEFEVTCFLANVREAYERNNIVEMQKKLVAHVNISADTIQNEYVGQRMIQNSFCNKKVLLVLDDVSNEVQLKNLVGKKDWFGPGSRIIITTRDEQLLRIQGVHGTYNVQCLVENESMELLCLKAFKQIDPSEGFSGLLKEVVECCGGLPLALDVLGSNLYGKPGNVWSETIEKIRGTNPISGIHDRLKISYDGLDPVEKNIFLDIACFFKGNKIDYVKDVLKKCGYYAEAGIDTLIDRSLVTINQVSNVLDMHDLLQDMGRSIVIQESPNDPGRRSRLWSLKDIDLVLTNDKGAETIQGIVFSDLWLDAQWNWSAKAFSNMTQLKLLMLDMPKFPHGLNCLPTSLKVLRCEGYPLKTLPLADNQQYELVEINLQDSRIEHLWHGQKFLGMLKYLNLSHCMELKQTPDLSAVPILQTLLIVHCWRLIEVHPSVAHHKNLTLLDLTDCRDLETLPGKLEMSSLNELILDDCFCFQNLPEFGECMKSLSRLSLKRTAIRKLPTSLACLAGLEDLNLDTLVKPGFNPNAIDELKYLNISTREYGNLPLLRTRNLSTCNLNEKSFPPDFGNLNEKSFPPDFGHLQSLMNLDLSGNNFLSMPMSIHELPRLRCLKLNSCPNLRSLPELPSSIRELEARGCHSLDISEINTSSNVCGAFVLPSQNRGPVLLEMVISGTKIPSWFVHQQDGNSVSIPYCHYPLNRRLGIALCFQIETIDRSVLGGSMERHLECALVVRDGNNTFIANRNIPVAIALEDSHKAPKLRKNKIKKDSHHYIICLANNYFSDGFDPGTCFELSIVNKDPCLYVSMISSARWVCFKDIEDLKKSAIERRPKMKHKKCLTDQQKH